VTLKHSDDINVVKTLKTLIEGKRAAAHYLSSGGKLANGRPKSKRRVCGMIIKRYSPNAIFIHIIMLLCIWILIY